MFRAERQGPGKMRIETDGIGVPPAIVLIEPQMGENIGKAARAMLNCGLTDMRIVRPRDGWPNRRARANASGADSVIDAVRVCETEDDAIGDLNRIYVTTARRRDVIKPVLTPRAMAPEIRAQAARGEKVGVLFGPERTGIRNEHVARADALVTVPLNPGFTSLNLAQAVLLIGYEWFQAGDTTPGYEMVLGDTVPGERAELERLFDALEGELDAADFWRVAHKKPAMWRNIRNTFLRTGLTHQEIQTLRGMIVALTGARKRR